MEAFATVDDLEQRWREFSDEERPIAEVRLLDVTAYIAGELERFRVKVDKEDEVQAHNLKAVCCNVARRSLAPLFSGDTSGAQYSSETMTAGVFSQTYNYSNPTGDMYMLKSEKRLLGIGRVLVSQVLPHCDRFDDA